MDTPPDATPPQRFAFSIGGYTGPSHALQWQDGRLLYRRYDYGYRADGEALEIRPDAAAWQAFYAAVVACKAAQWPERWVCDLQIMDGTGWSFELEAQGLKVSSGGSNAFPPDRQFNALLRALRALSGKRIS